MTKHQVGSGVSRSTGAENGLELYRGHVTTRLIVAVIVLLFVLISRALDSLAMHVLGLALTYIVAVFTGMFMVRGLRVFAEQRPDAGARPIIRFARALLIGSLIADTFVALMVITVLPYFFEPLAALRSITPLVDWLFPHFDDLVGWSTALACVHYIALLIAGRRLCAEHGLHQLRRKAGMLTIGITVVAVALLLPLSPPGTIASIYAIATLVGLIAALGVYVSLLSQLGDALDAAPDRAPLPESRLVT